MKRISYIIILVEIILLVLLPVGAWLASVLGGNIQNPVSEEGIRWLFQHGAASLAAEPKYMANIMLLVMAVGAVKESRWLVDWMTEAWNGGKGNDTSAKTERGGRMVTDEGRRRRFALRCAIFYLLCAMLCLTAVLFMPHSPLLGVTGSIVPSPWLTGFGAAIFLHVIVACIIYKAVQGTLGGGLGIPQICTAGFRLYGEWMAVFMLFSLLVRIGKYCVGG